MEYWSIDVMNTIDMQCWCKWRWMCDYSLDTYHLASLAPPTNTNNIPLFATALSRSGEGAHFVPLEITNLKSIESFTEMPKQEPQTLVPTPFLHSHHQHQTLPNLSNLKFHH